MAAIDNLNYEQLQKLSTTYHRRKNNLETKYGGTIHENSLEPYRSQMTKLRNEHKEVLNRMMTMNTDESEPS